MATLRYCIGMSDIILSLVRELRDLIRSRKSTVAPTYPETSADKLRKQTSLG